MKTIFLIIVFLINQTFSKLLYTGDDQKRPGLGINVGPIDSDMSLWVFTNRFKHAREWSPIGSNNNWKSTTYSGSFNTTWSTNGYPIWFNTNPNSWTQVGYSTVLGTSGLYTPGDYVVKFDGTGNITLLGDASNLKFFKNRVEFSVKNATTSGIILIITKPNVTNIDLREVSDEFTTGTFTKKFLDAIRPFEVLRFASWMVNRQGNRDTLANVDWSNRRLSNFYTQVGQNMVSIELIIELGNLLSKDIWLSIPSSCNDGLIRNLSNYLKNNFNPNRTIYVEQTSDKGWDQNNRNIQMNLISQFKSVFGNSQRVKYVLSTWLGAYFENTISKYSNDDLTQFHAFSIGGDISYNIEYNFDNYQINNSKDLQVQDILDNIRQQIFKDEISLIYLIHKVSIRLNLTVIGYNVGFNVHAPGFASRFRKINDPILEQRLEDLIIEALRQPLVEDLYLDFMERWYKSGGGLMVLNNLVEKVDRCLNGGGKCGYRSLLENFLQNPQSVPKYSAAVKWLNGERSSLPFTSDDFPETPKYSCDNCKFGTCHKGSCVCFDGYTGSQCDQLSEKYLDCASDKTEYAMNLNGIPDWSTELTFIDLQRRARKWIGHKTVFPSEWGELKSMPESQFRDDGYPKYLNLGEMVGTFMTRDLMSHYPNGEYLCLYDGDGVLDFWFEDNKITKRTPGRIEFNVTHKTEMNNGIYYNIIRTNPSNPIRNVRIIEKRYEIIYQDFPFQPSFLEFLKKFQTIRFMPWSNINVDQLFDWSNRTTDDYYTFNLRTGVSLEKQVLLCNTLGSNPWFNLPHRATDNYVQKWAEYVKDNLRPDVKIYIEIGNECWGSGGPHECGNYAQKMGYNMTLKSNPNKKYNSDLIARICYHAQTGQRYLNIIKQVYGSKYNRDKIRLVMATQAAWSYPLEIFYLCTGDFYESYDVIAIAPYMSASLKLNGNLVTLEDFYSKIADQGIKNAANQLLTISKIVQTSSPNMEMALYEAGPDFSSLTETWNTNLTLLSYEIHRDPRMYFALRDYLNNMTKLTNLKVYSHFYSVGAYSKYGCWSLLESSDSDRSKSPKYLAFMDHIDENKVCQWKEKEEVCNLNCSNSGDCVINPLTNRKEFCNCNFGSQGNSCENLNYIKSERCTYQCGGKGVCSYNHTEGFYLVHTCKCNQGYSGYGCKIFSCQNECNYNGKCLDKDVCSCYRGFKGQFCDVDCKCNGHGKCSETTNECLCDTGYLLIGGTCVADCSVSTLTECQTCPECNYGDCVRGQCKCWAGYGLDSEKKCTVKVPSPNDGSKIGVNLNGVVDWSTQWAFIDLGKQARDWIVQHADELNNLYIWSLDEKIELRGDRYPARIPNDRKLVTLMLRSVLQKWPNSVYHVFYDGEGLLDFGFDAKIIEQKEKNKLKIQVTLSTIRDNGVLLKIQKSNPNNPIRNIRIVMDGYQDIYDKIPFHPLFLERLSRFKTIRFMPWTEEKGIINWSDRITPTSYTQGKGVAYEYQILLCNLLKTDGWFHVPYEANDEFVQNLARLIKESLRKDIKVYIEYTNEAWNSFFDSGKYAIKMGLALNLSSDPVIARNLFYSKRSVEIIKIFKQIFGDEQDRLVLVLGSFLLMPIMTSRILEFEKAYESHSNIMLAITGYISCGSPKAVDVVQLDLSNLFQGCDSDLPNMNNTIKSHYELTRKYNVGLGMYESGSGLMELSAILQGTETPGATDKYIQWNRDQRMYKVYKDYYKMFDVYNMTANCHYGYVGFPSKYGSFHLMEYQDQPLDLAHRYRAIMEIINETRSQS